MAEGHDEQQSFVKRFLPYLIFAGVIVIGGIIGLVFYLQKTGGKFVLGAQSSNPQENVAKIVDTVGKLIELPNETPTVATVSDVTKLSGQQFFAHAENGDEVLIYKNAKKAILYRPSINKIIEVGPVNLAPDQTSTQSASTTQVSTTPVQTRVVILNGTSTSGLTKKAEDQLVGKDASISVINRDNASRQDYTKTVVVDLTGKNAANAGKIANIVNGEIGKLPDGETKPDADILIILGSNYLSK